MEQHISARGTTMVSPKQNETKEEFIARQLPKTMNLKSTTDERHAYEICSKIYDEWSERANKHAEELLGGN